MITKSIFRFFSSQNKALKHIFVLGAPGVGKSFYGAKMASDFGYELIVLGQEVLKESSKAQVASQIAQGKLVDDQFVFDILNRRLQQGTNKQGFIIEGFPRTPRQLQLYLEQGYPISLVLNFTLERAVLEKRVLGRLTCTSCKTTYNYFSFKSGGLDIDANLPRVKDVCDCCGGKVESRLDDTNEVIHAKMERYFDTSKGVLHELILTSMRDNIKQYNVIEYSPVKGMNNYKDFSNKIKLVFESL